MRNRRLLVIGAVTAAILPLVALTLGILRARPFVDDVSPSLSAGDDWLTYKQFALSVLRDGLTMPALRGSYSSYGGAAPHGFLYVYFVALVFAVSGVNTSHVYIVQSFTLGLSVSLTYAAFRRKLSPAMGLAFLLALGGFAYNDMFRAITFRLLSENLYFLLYPVMLILLFSALDSGGRGRGPLDALAAGLVLGLIVLTRPNLVLSAGALVVAILGYAHVKGLGMRLPVSLLLGTAVGASAVAVRNYVATGRPAVDLVTNTSDWIRTYNSPLLTFLSVLAKRALFVFGYTPLMAAAYRPRPHWMLAWLLCMAYPVLALRRRRRIEIWELLLYVYIACYVVPVVLVGDVSSYGGRMVVMILPMVVVLACRAVELLPFVSRRST
jgi:hypothetical protein